MIERERTTTPATLRPMDRHDLSAMHAVLRECEAFDRIPIVTTLELFEEELCSDPVDLDTDVRVAEHDGAIVGYVYTYHLPSDVREERCYVFGNVAPPFRRQGVGSQLMHWAMQRAEEQLRSSGRSLPRYIRTDRLDHVEGAHALYRSMGMTPVRYHEELLRSLDDLPPVVVPDGARIVPWPAERTDELRAVKNEAFADHWGSTPTSVEHWRQLTEGSFSRLDLSSAVLDHDDRIVALCLVTRFPEDDELLGRRDAWIDKLATARDWRGRGLASALVAHSLHLFHHDGLTHASIGVDADNPTGAARLYKALGFSTRHRSTTSQVEV